MSVAELGKCAAGLTAVALQGLFGPRRAGSAGILVYHRVAANVPHGHQPTLNVTPARFRQHIAGLLARGFTFWPLCQLLRCHTMATPVPPRTLVLTFDDAYETVYRNAWPVLKELNVPATVFLSTAYLDSASPFPFDAWGVAHRGVVPAESYRPLTAAQCGEMAQQGLVELGSHTHTHANFRGSTAAFRQDLQESLAVLRARFGLREVPFAFPFGKVHAGHAGGELAAAAREAGVLCALSTECELVDPRSDPFQWGRLGVYQWDTVETLAAKRAGWYSWAPQLYGRLARAGHACRAPATPNCGKQPATVLRNHRL